MVSGSFRQEGKLTCLPLGKERNVKPVRAEPALFVRGISMSKEGLKLGKLTALDEAQAKYFEAVKEALKDPVCEEIPIEEALGRVLAADVKAGEDVPNFTRSTVDGYAVFGEETFGCSEENPVYLKLAGRVPMGEGTSLSLEKGQAVRVATGGMLPFKANAVVMIEHTELYGDTVEIKRAVAPGDNVIRKGQDVEAGETLLKRGHRLRTQDIGALAGIGRVWVSVTRKPVVGIISTGDEVIDAAKKPAIGQIRDMNSYGLVAEVIKANGDYRLYGIVEDEFNSLKKKMIKALAECDLVLLSGGSSVDVRDVAADVINDLGEPGVLIHGVAIKPGKPTILALVGEKPIIGLPGHPVSALVNYELFGLPVIRMLTGENVIQPLRGTLRARIGRNVARVANRAEFIRVTLREEAGEWWAVPVLGESGMISTMVKADGLIAIPMEKTGLEAGELVEVKLFD